jgi:hypothetical protein
MMRSIDLRNLKDLTCSESKLEAFQIYIIEHTEPGDEVELVIDDVNIWNSLRRIGRDIGFEILLSEKVHDDEYRIVIRIM